jgi:hypothetical protein
LNGRLYGDLADTAYVRRAVCLAELGDMPAAHTALDELEQGAPNLDQVYAARSFVLGKEGRKKRPRLSGRKPGGSIRVLSSSKIELLS